MTRVLTPVSGEVSLNGGGALLAVSPTHARIMVRMRVNLLGVCPLHVLVVLLIIPWFRPVQSQTGDGATEIVATLDSGELEVAPLGTEDWHPAKPNQGFHIGEKIRVAEGTRAALRLKEGGIVQLDGGSEVALAVLGPREEPAAPGQKRLA